MGYREGGGTLRLPCPDGTQVEVNPSGSGADAPCVPMEWEWGAQDALGALPIAKVPGAMLNPCCLTPLPRHCQPERGGTAPGHHNSLAVCAGEAESSQAGSLLLINLHPICLRLLCFPNTIKTSVPATSCHGEPLGTTA